MSNQIITTLIDGGNIIGKVSGFTYSSVQAELETKAEKDYVDGQDALKADKATTYLRTEIDAKDALKADKTYTDAQLAEKALKTEVGTLGSLLTIAKTSLVNAINELFTNKANKAQEAWIIPTLSNGFAIPATRHFRYRKNDDGVVYIDGVITGGTPALVALTMPSGYRPFGSITFNVGVFDFTNDYCMGQISSAGVLSFYTTYTPSRPYRILISYVGV